MKKNIVNIFVMLFVSLSIFAQKTPSSSLSTSTVASSATLQLQEAKDFGLSAVKAYFDANCAYVYSKLNNEITSIESGQKFDKSAISQQDFCTESPLRKDIRVSYAQYLQNYSPQVFDATTFAAQYPEMQQALQLKEGDFFFNGANLNSNATDLFRAADMTRFVLRRIGQNQFVILAM